MQRKGLYATHLCRYHQSSGLIASRTIQSGNFAKVNPFVCSLGGSLSTLECSRIWGPKRQFDTAKDKRSESARQGRPKQGRGDWAETESRKVYSFLFAWCCIGFSGVSRACNLAPLG